MAKFKGKNLKLDTSQSVYFGDSDQARLWFETDLNLNHTVSGVAATAGHHLIRKDQVDDALATLSGSIITDHGQLTGRDDDDHTIYTLADGTRDFSGVIKYTSHPTFNADTQLVDKQYVDSLAQGLDWQDSVISKSYNDPSTISGTTLGDRYIIGTTASGAWAGNENNIAEYNGSGWDVISSNEGFASWVEDEDIIYVYNGSSWVKFGATITHGNLIGLDQDDHPQYHTDARGDARYYTQGQVDTISGAIVDQIPSLSGYATESYVDNHNWYEADILDLDKYTQVEVDTMISGVNASIITDHGALSGLTDDDHTQYVPTNADRGFTATVSGVDPTEDYHLATKFYIDNELATISGGIVQDHGSLVGLDDDDHLQYVPTNADRGFTATVSGVGPTQDYHLATKKYIDDEITSNVITAHSGLSGLDQDDHTQYILATGVRAFSGTVSGVAPTADAHLTTKQYVDSAITTATGSLTTDHGSLVGLVDDDHLQYVPVNADRGFTATVSGVDPTQDYHLTTKSYVDSVSVDRIQSGRVTLAYHEESKAVTLGTAFADTNYSISVLMTNTTDVNPGIYPVVTSAKSNTGFTVEFSGKIDSSNYTLEWIVIHD